MEPATIAKFLLKVDSENPATALSVSAYVWRESSFLPGHGCPAPPQCGFKVGRRLAGSWLSGKHARKGPGGLPELSSEPLTHYPLRRLFLVGCPGWNGPGCGAHLKMGFGQGYEGGRLTFLCPAAFSPPFPVPDTLIFSVPTSI